MGSFDTGIDVDGLETTVTALEDAKPSEATWTVGTDVEYSVYVEYGTRHMEAQPFLRPAVRQTMREADSIAEDADDADELVEAIAKRIEERAKEKAPVDTGRLMRSIEAEEVK